MSLEVMLVVLCSALLHAGWNALVRASADTFLASLHVVCGAGAFEEEFLSIDFNCSKANISIPHPEFGGFYRVGMKMAQPGIKTYGMTVEGQKGQEVRCALAGRIALENAYEVLAELRALLDQLIPTKLNVDLAKIDYLDSSGALARSTLQRDARKKNIPLSFLNTTPEAQRVMDLIDMQAIEAPPLRQEEQLNIFEQLGQGSIGLVEEAYQLLSFFGELLTAHGGRQLSVTL